MSRTAREIDWRCGKYGSNDAHQMLRDGHYRRHLATGWGYLENIRVPMLEWAKCGHAVVIQWTILEKYARFWLDFEQKARFGSGLCQSLRQLRDEWNAALGGSVGLSLFGSERGAKVAVFLQVQRLMGFGRVSLGGRFRNLSGFALTVLFSILRVPHVIKKFSILT
jgi:hypothetical protein